MDRTNTIWLFSLLNACKVIWGNSDDDPYILVTGDNSILNEIVRTMGGVWIDRRNKDGTHALTIHLDDLHKYISA